MHKLNAIILMVLVTIAKCNSIEIKKLYDEVFWHDGKMKPLNR